MNAQYLTKSVLSSSSPEGLTENLEMQNFEDIKNKMVSLWNLMNKNSTLRLEYVENMPRMRSPTYDTDAIAQGVLSMEEAEYRLKRYRETFFAHYMLVEIPEDITIERLRRESPLLFLTIMSVTSVSMEGEDKREACIILHNQSIDAIVYETMILGNKSLELLKCLILLNVWYNTPEMYHHQKSHLLTHLCTTLAIDLGLGGTTYETHQTDGIKYNRILKPYLLVNPQTLECRKLWLCVYISSIHVSTVIRRPVFLMWSKYTEECCSILEQPERDSSERRIAALARLNHLHEKISAALQSVDSVTPPDVNDPRTRSIIKYFEHKLQQISGMVNLGKSIYATSLYLVQIYLHEFAMYVPYNKDMGRTPYCEYSLAIGQMQITVHTAQAIGWCYSSSIRCLESIASQSVKDLAAMPFFIYSRAAFSASTLLKLRTLYLTTSNFHQVCTVKSSSLTPINTLMRKLEQVIARYPFANSAVNFCFILQVLICHFDRRLHAYFHPDATTESHQYIPVPKYFSESGSQRRGSEMDRSGITNRRASGTPKSDTATPQANANVYLKLASPGGVESARRASELQPDSPLDILSSVAIDPALQKRLDEENGTPGLSVIGAGEYMDEDSFPRRNGNSIGGDGRMGTPKSGYSSLPLSRRLSAVYGSRTNGNGTTGMDGLASISASAAGPAPGLGASSGINFNGGPANDASSSNVSGGGNGTNGLTSAEPGYPEWLITDDFWKELVPGTDSMGLFDLY